MAQRSPGRSINVSQQAPGFSLVGNNASAESDNVEGVLSMISLVHISVLSFSSCCDSWRQTQSVTIATWVSGLIYSFLPEAFLYSLKDRAEQESGDSSFTHSEDGFCFLTQLR